MGREEELQKWFHETPNLGFMVPDCHRLQLEYFIWKESKKLSLEAPILEIGAILKKPYLMRPNLITLNCEDPEDADWHNVVQGISSPDIYGDIIQLPFKDEQFDCIIATETLEHVSDPCRALKECFRVLRPGGIALFSTPFMWPYHGGQRYPDYWRFTADGWRLLCKDFDSVRVYPTEFSANSPTTELVFTERMGRLDEVRLATGYLVKAVKK